MLDFKYALGAVPPNMKKLKDTVVANSDIISFQEGS